MHLWFWLLMGPAIALAVLSLRGEWSRARYVEERLAAAPPAGLPRATVIIPVKGDDENLRDNLASFANLDYPDYELLITARTAADIPPGVLPNGVKLILDNAAQPGASEKIQNLNGALRLSRRTSQVFAFADSDGQAPRGWLRALVEPLLDDSVGASTGYRWYLPTPPDFWSLMRSVWNAAIASTLGPGDAPFAWGGSMALRRDRILDLRIQELWNLWVSDDYAVTEAVHAAGLRIAFAPGAVVAATEHLTAAEFFRWTRRQMIITRVYNPRLWWTGLLAHVIYCAGMAAAVAASIAGDRLAEWALIAQLSPGMLKGSNRAVLAKAELPQFKQWFDRHGWVHTWFVPIATWLWLIALAGAAFTRTIHWRGRKYTLVRPVLEPRQSARPNELE